MLNPAICLSLHLSMIDTTKVHSTTRGFARCMREQIYKMLICFLFPTGLSLASVLIRLIVRVSFFFIISFVCVYLRLI
jgi:hypothetical protein